MLFGAKPLAKTLLRIGALVSLAATLTAMSGDVPVLTESQQRRMDRLLEGKTVEQPEMCIHAARALARDGLIVISDRVLLFRVSTNIIYRNDTQQLCDHMARSPFQPIISHDGSSICRGDTVTTDRGSCALGDFVPYRRVRPQ
jgi:hypothetical protein